VDAAFEAVYHELESEHWWFRSRRAFVRGWLTKLGAGADTRLLDLGCASGTLLRELQGAGWSRAAGVDFSDVAVARCRSNGLTGVVLGDAADPPCDECSVDVLVASDVLEHLSDDALAVRRWFEVTRPGGHAVVCVPAYAWLWSDHDVVNHHYRRYTRSGLRRLLTDAGWEVAHSGYWNSALLPAVTAVRIAQRVVRRLSGEVARSSNHEVRGQLARTRGWLDAAVGAWMSLENRWILAGGVFPAGISTYVIARKPEGTTCGQDNGTLKTECAVEAFA
jgi:SAM-dependent methyltransferase